MEIFKKKKLLYFLFLFFVFIPFINVKALTGNDGVEYPDVPNDGHTQFIIGKENNDNEIKLLTFNDNVKYFYTTTWESRSGGRVGAFFYATGEFGNITSDVRFSTKEYLLKNGEWSLLSSYTSHTCNTIAYMTPLYSTMDIYFDGTTSNSTYPSGYYYISGEHTKGDLVYSSNKSIVLEEKKNFSYDNSEMTNPMRYIDLYFDKEDMGKEISFELKIEDYFEYSSCSYCEYLNIDKFVFSYLIKDENGLYKWIELPYSQNQVSVDYDGQELPRNENGTGFTISGRIRLYYDNSLYDFQQIRVSFKLSNAYNFKYTYSDDSNISEGNIDEYYHYMTYNYGERLNRIEGGDTKYTILSTTEDEINASLIVQYINTNKWLYIEYFDIFSHSYIENSNIISEQYIFADKEIGISKFTIGKNNNRGVYLMNYLYKKDGKNLDSKYYFYIPINVSYSYVDYLEDAIYYDNEININNSITPNPNYETDNLHFIDNFKGINEFLEKLQTTSDTFNYMWNSFYNNMPSIIKGFFKFATHLLCMLIFMKIVGYD